MKNLRAKQVPIRTVVTSALAVLLLTIMTASNEAAVMATGWEGFKTAMTNFFYKGLGGEGMQGIGIVIAVVGVAMAVISFVIHKINPQSRMPGWFTCLVIALLGTMLFSGVGPVLKIIQWLRDTVLGWFGFTGFGNFE